MGTFGVLHPGEMGTALAAGLVASGASVLWAGEGRSAATRARAEGAGLVDVGTVEAMAARAEVVVAVCPPEAALRTAADVAATGFRGIYVDANAIGPATAAEVAGTVSAGGGTFVDASVIGGPDRPRLFVCGEHSDVGDSFGPPVVLTVLRSGGPYAASALKMTYAGWTKASSALLLAVTAAAERLGIGDLLREEWERSQPALPGRLN